VGRKRFAAAGVLLVVAALCACRPGGHRSRVDWMQPERAFPLGSSSAAIAALVPDLGPAQFDEAGGDVRVARRWLMGCAVTVKFRFDCDSLRSVEYVGGHFLRPLGGFVYDRLVASFSRRLGAPRADEGGDPPYYVKWKTWHVGAGEIEVTNRIEDWDEFVHWTYREARRAA